MGDIHLENENKMGGKYYGDPSGIRLQRCEGDGNCLGSNPVAHCGAGGCGPAVAYCFQMLVKLLTGVFKGNKNMSCPVLTCVRQ
jgi:hypothetical protein